MNASDVIALISVVLSVVALCVAYQTHRDGMTAASRPILVFSMVSTYKWQVQNVGVGPALNVIVADTRRDGVVDTVTDCYPIAPGGHVNLIWLRGGWKLTVAYTDVDGAYYSTVCAGQNTISKGNILSGVSTDSYQWVYEIQHEEEAPSRLRPRDLHGKTAKELDIMRNEKYARLGYIFNSTDLQDYFDAQDWYEPRTDDMHAINSKMSPREKFEAHIIRFYQDRHGLLIQRS